MGEIFFMKNPVLIIFNALRSLSFRKVVKLLSLNLRHPLFSIIALFTTVKTFHLAQKFFPKTNSKNGIGNAFRHALWTSMMMMYCCKISSPQKSYLFTKTFTDLHEELFPNRPLERKMDLHNNLVGLNMFMTMLKGIHRQFFEVGFLVEQLFVKTKTAKVLKNINEEHGEELVYLDDN